MSPDQILQYLADNALGIAALILSIIGFFWNRQHTNRTFQASNYPALRVILRKAYSYAYPRLFTSLWLRVRNLSNDKSVSHVTASLMIRKARTGVRFWQQSRWVLYDSVEGEFGISPAESWRGDIKPSLEEFMTQHFPDMLRKEETPTAPYRVLQKHPLDLLLTVTYQPAVYGSKRCIISKIYKLVPMGDCIPAEWKQGESDKDITELLDTEYWNLQERR